MNTIEPKSPPCCYLDHIKRSGSSLILAVWGTKENENRALERCPASRLEASATIGTRNARPDGKNRRTAATAFERSRVMPECDPSYEYSLLKSLG
jgi:hypothetical protein